ncbi:plasmid mobilization relaxosome protein MobC [Nocardia sp. 348MFTsu5.1]|uniref:plasmid mobilization protein n=1 Tax=Nocardia sp. 348MFTsu5.1 TaxID=1172185 RepID=UPI0003793AAF|nr:plasmid mobilization relaxosome protein MobC [Nocardia sp. 348MFTsu5.1]
MAEDTADEQQASRPSRSIIRRRRANVPGGRDEKIEVKVTADEKELLRARGKLMNMSPQRLMVTSALGQNSAPRVDYADRKQAWDQACELRNLIAAIGNNMNQIARQANSDEQIPADFATALDAVMRAHRRVFDAFGETFGFEGQLG